VKLGNFVQRTKNYVIARLLNTSIWINLDYCICILGHLLSNLMYSNCAFDLHHCVKSNEFKANYSHKAGRLSQTVLRPIHELWTEALEGLTSLHCKQITAFLWCLSFFGHTVQYTQSWEFPKHTQTPHVLMEELKAKIYLIKVSGLKTYTVIAKVF